MSANYNDWLFSQLEKEPTSEESSYEDSLALIELTSK